MFIFDENNVLYDIYQFLFQKNNEFIFLYIDITFQDFDGTTR